VDRCDIVSICVPIPDLLWQDVLPLLVSPSPTLALHVTNALSGVHLQSSEPPAHAQLRALAYAVRWESGVESTDFSGSILEGERWLVWAAGNVKSLQNPMLWYGWLTLVERQRRLHRHFCWLMLRY
jgi:hypothetical protein